VALVAHEAWVLVLLVYTVRGEIQTVGDVLPVWDQGGHIIVHGQVGIPIHLAANETQIPSPVIVGVLEVGEVEWLRGGHHEEVPHSRIVIYEPIRRSGEKNPIIPSSPGIVVLLGRVGEDHPDGTIGIDMEDRHKGVFRNPVIKPRCFSPLKNRFMPSVQPDSGLKRIDFGLLGIRRCVKEA